MKPLYINLNKKTPTNYLRLLLGIIMMGATIYIQFFSAITRFQPYQLLLLFLFGVYYAIMGAGHNLLNLSFKRYISIDDNGIILKSSLIKAKSELPWNEIAEVQINITSIRLKLQNKTDIQFEYQMLDDDTIHTLKTAIIHQAKEQGINIA